MVWIMKIAKRLQEAPNFRRPVSRTPPLREQFLDEAQAARDELLSEILVTVGRDSSFPSLLTISMVSESNHTL